MDVILVNARVLGHRWTHTKALQRIAAQILSMLDNVEIDAGLRYLNNEPLGRVTTVLLYAERYVLVTKAGHPLLTGPVRWGDLGGGAVVPADAGYAEPPYYHPAFVASRCRGHTANRSILDHCPCEPRCAQQSGNDSADQSG
jgi:DNA-binding transcriptional LysR family regulator